MKRLFCAVLIISVLATGCGKGNKNTKVIEDTSSGAITVESEVDNKLDDSKEQVEKGVNDVVDKASETISNTGNAVKDTVKDAVKGVSESKASGDNAKGSSASSNGGNSKTNSTPKSEKPSSNSNKPVVTPTPKPTQPPVEKPTQPSTPSQPSFKPGINQALTSAINSNASLNDYGISKKLSFFNDITTKVALGQMSASSAKSNIQGLQDWEDTCKINRGNALYTVTGVTICVFKTSSNNSMDIVGEAMRTHNRPEGNYIYNVAYKNTDGTNTIVMLGVILSPFIASN